MPGDKFSTGQTKAGAKGGSAPMKIRVMKDSKWGKWTSGVGRNDVDLLLKKSNKQRK